MQFIEQAKNMASKHDINWDMQIDKKGMAKDFWNLTLLAGAGPPLLYLRDFSLNPKAIDFLNIERIENGLDLLLRDHPIPFFWQELIKAATIEQLFYKRNTPVHIVNNVVHPLRLMATCAFHIQPWEVSIDELNLAIRIGNKIQNSGTLGDLVKGITINVFDAEHIANKSPLYPALSTTRHSLTKSQRARYIKTKEELRDNLEDRKRSERLPDRKAFWELIRILFTERPKSFTDELRFLALKSLLTTGLRAGEIVRIPADWKRVHDYFNINGFTKNSSGYSSSLMFRYFPEKQQPRESDSSVLIEDTQHVPRIFQELINESLDKALSLTEPLRKTLRKQVEASRMLPWYDKNDLVPAIELYPVLTGNPFLLRDDVINRSRYIERYNANFNPSVFQELKQIQKNQIIISKGKVTFTSAFYNYYTRFKDMILSRNSSLKFYKGNGTPLPISGIMSWNDVHLKIGELEEYLKDNVPTKMSDIQPMRLSDGYLQSWELLFLHPKRSVSEERNGGLCDITQYMSVSRPDSHLLLLFLELNNSSIFKKYGATPEDQSLSMLSHSLRHLQNTELFRQGVADTIITKRFNRKNIVQSYEYDHRSLAEDLDQIELPDGIEDMLGEKASITAKMILAGKTSGPIVEGFKRIQRLEGDEAAFQYLKGEADGFHVTPYGHCLNSFNVDPCPKNLECFAGCRHLAASNLSSNIKHLTSLENKLKAALEEVERRPITSIGRDNQIQHAQIRLEGIRRLLDTQEGCLVFPEGTDLSRKASRSILDE